MNDPELRAAVIAAAVALLVGVLSQVVSVGNQLLTHRLTQLRETQKYYNEVYQKLFAPVISDVFLYIDMVSNFRRGHDTTQEQEVAVKNRAIEHIKNNLVYASPRLVSSFHQIRSSAITDQRGANPSTAELFFLHDSVQEYVDVIDRSSIFLGNNKRDQMIPAYRRLILYFLHMNFEAMIHIDIVSYSWKFDQGAYDLGSYRRIRKIMENMNRRTTKLVARERKWSKNLEKSLDGKDRQEYTRLWNESTKEHHPVVESEYREITEETLRRILNIMIRDKGDREEVMRWLIKEKQYYYHHDPNDPSGI